MFRATIARDKTILSVPLVADFHVRPPRPDYRLRTVRPLERELQLAGARGANYGAAGVAKGRHAALSGRFCRGPGEAAGGLIGQLRLRTLARPGTGDRQGASGSARHQRRWPLL